jgi:hypothetical protein
VLNSFAKNINPSMKKNLTKTILFFLLALLGFSKSDAQQVRDTLSAPKPILYNITNNQGKIPGNLWGYAFGDFYYKAHSDSLNRGGSNQYTNIGQTRNAFQFRRIYLGYNLDITSKYQVELLLASEDNLTTSATPSAPSTTSGDLLTNNKVSFYIKLLNLRIKNVWRGTDLVLGQQVSPAFPLLAEKIWGYRSSERTVADIRRTPSFDLGIGLQGFFDPETKNFGYNLLAANGTSAKPSNTIFKWFYGDIFAKFLDKKLIIDLYVDYNKLAPNTATTPYQSRNMIKGYIAYTTPKITFGVEAFTNKIINGVITTDAAKVTSYADLNAVAISAYVHGFIITEKLGFFARYDNYNPETNFNTSLIYSKPAVSQYDPNNKEIFFNAGLDYSPVKNIHFMPNVWYDRYTSQLANVTGLAQQDHDLVYRMTAFFTWGK